MATRQPERIRGVFEAKMEEAGEEASTERTSDARSRFQARRRQEINKPRLTVTHKHIEHTVTHRFVFLRCLVPDSFE